MTGKTARLPSAKRAIPSTPELAGRQRGALCQGFQLLTAHPIGDRIAQLALKRGLIGRFAGSSGAIGFDQIIRAR